VILLDISGSMSSAFEGNKGSNMTKMQVACKSLIALLTHLRCSDRVGLVLFNNNVQVRFPLTEFRELPISTIRQLMQIYAGGGTNFEKGYKACIEQYVQLFNSLKAKEAKKKDDDNKDEAEEIEEEYDNRIMVLTDMCPTAGKKGSDALMNLVKEHAEKVDQDRIYTTFIGIGLDFNTKLVSAISKVRGANYFSVHTNAEFVKKLDEEFDFMVSPLVFNLKLTLKSEGDVAYIDAVYGTDDAEDLQKGEVMSIKTLFPSPTNDDGDTKGGIVLLRVRQKERGDDAKKTFNMVIDCQFEDKYGQKYANQQVVTFGGENQQNSDDYYDNNGVHKGIVLTRFVTLMKQWIIHDRYFFYPKNFANQQAKVKLSNKYKKIFASFMSYFEKEIPKIGDKTLQKEMDLLKKVCSEEYLAAAAKHVIQKVRKLHPIPRPHYVRGRPYNIECEENEVIETDINFESLEADMKVVAMADNKWTMQPQVSIADDVQIDLQQLSVDELRAGYAEWLQQGLAEHASIASFSRFSLDLISLAAPSFLIELVHQASLDEIRHSKIAFDLANMFLSAMGDEHEHHGKCVNPAMIATHHINVDANCHRILTDLINGGCFNELVSALQSLTDAKNLKSKQLLYSVAMDEVKHCSLAWIAMTWILDNYQEQMAEDVDIRQMYESRLKSVANSDDVETVYAFNVIIPDLLQLVLAKTPMRDYQELYNALKLKLEGYMESFKQKHGDHEQESMCDII